MIIHLEDSSKFQEEVKEGLVLIDFFATWCGPCMMLSPVIEQLDKEMDIKVVKIDTDQHGDIAQAFRIMSIPTLFLLKDGKPIKKTMGYMPLDALKKFVQEN